MAFLPESFFYPFDIVYITCIYIYIYYMYICSNNANSSQQDWKGIPTSTCFPEDMQTLGTFEKSSIPVILNTHLKPLFFTLFHKYRCTSIDFGPILCHTRGSEWKWDGINQLLCPKHIFCDYVFFLLGPALHICRCIYSRHASEYLMPIPIQSVRTAWRNSIRRNDVSKVVRFQALPCIKMQTVRLMCAYDMPNCPNSKKNVLRCLSTGGQGQLLIMYVFTYV